MIKKALVVNVGALAAGAVLPAASLRIKREVESRTARGQMGQEGFDSSSRVGSGLDKNDFNVDDLVGKSYITAGLIGGETWKNVFGDLDKVGDNGIGKKYTEGFIEMAIATEVDRALSDSWDWNSRLKTVRQSRSWKGHQKLVECLKTPKKSTVNWNRGVCYSFGSTGKELDGGSGAKDRIGVINFKGEELFKSNEKDWGSWRFKNLWNFTENDVKGLISRTENGYKLNREKAEAILSKIKGR